jgi:hypothetical protein
MWYSLSTLDFFLFIVLLILFIFSLSFLLLSFQLFPISENSFIYINFFGFKDFRFFPLFSLSLSLILSPLIPFDLIYPHLFRLKLTFSSLYPSWYFSISSLASFIYFFHSIYREWWSSWVFIGRMIVGIYSLGLISTLYFDCSHWPSIFVLASLHQFYGGLKGLEHVFLFDNVVHMQRRGLVCCLVLLGGMKEIQRGGVLQKIMHKQRKRMKLEGPCSEEKNCFKLTLQTMSFWAFAVK